MIYECRFASVINDDTVVTKKSTNFALRNEYKTDATKKEELDEMIIPSIVVHPAPPADDHPPAFETTEFVIDDHVRTSSSISLP